MLAEFELLAAIRPYLDGDSDAVPVGVGDDAAVVQVGEQPVVVAVDTMVDGVHVDLAWSSYGDLGAKAVAVNLSDLVAVAAEPVAAVVSLARPPELTRDEVEELYQGMRAMADEHGCLLVGGDVVGGDQLVVTVTVVGRPAEPGFVLRRGGAGRGDAVVVVGTLGRAAAALAAWRADRPDLLSEHPDLDRAHRRPVPLTAAVPALVAARPTAGIDVSDGLGRDLGHVATTSGVGISIDAQRLPVDPGVEAIAGELSLDPLELTVGGGDDYAVAVTIPPERIPTLRHRLDAAGVPVAVIGEVAGSSGVTMDNADVSTSGWEHT